MAKYWIVAAVFAVSMSFLVQERSSAQEGRDLEGYVHCIAIDGSSSALSDTLINNCPFTVSVGLVDESGHGPGLEIVSANGRQSTRPHQGRIIWMVCRYPATPVRSSQGQFRCQ